MCLAVPGRILGIRGEEPLWRAGRVDFGGVIKEVSLACVQRSAAGDYVIVHAGVAISRRGRGGSGTDGGSVAGDRCVVRTGGGWRVRFVEEYRDPDRARRVAEEIARASTRPWTLMEVCGGQTHSILRHGIDQVLPPGLTLIHGPGCPVCVTPVRLVDAALEIAARPGVLFCSFGDMLRVPGTRSDLLSAKAAGADVRMVYSPLDAVSLAARHPDREVVFFGVGFETTAPATALAVAQAAARGLTNFSLLVSHVRVPPAMEVLLSAADCRVQGFLAAGHVCTVMGTQEYESIAERYRVPIVVTGFEPVDILQGILGCVRQLEEGRHEVEP